MGMVSPRPQFPSTAMEDSTIQGAPTTSCSGLQLLHGCRTPEQSQPQHLSSSPLRTSPQPSDVILYQTWRSCTGDFHIGRYLDARQFPLSYRNLVYQWKDIAARATTDIQAVTEEQERAVIAVLHDYLERGHPVHFASHLDVFCRVQSEIIMLRTTGQDEARVYDDTCQTLLDAFDTDRSVCAARPPHDCLGRLLWGDVYAWSRAEIEFHLAVYLDRRRMMMRHSFCARRSPDFCTPPTPSTPLFSPASLSPLTPLRRTDALPPTPDFHASSWYADSIGTHLQSKSLVHLSNAPFTSTEDADSQAELQDADFDAIEECEAMLRDAAAQLGSAAQLLGTGGLSHHQSRKSSFLQRPRSCTPA